jgi:iron complex outermembrane receptor protein
MLRNDFYYTLSDREWRDAYTLAFNPQTNLIDRDRFAVTHYVTLVGNRFDVGVNRPLGRLANRFVAGFDVSALGFDRVPFYRGAADSVDRFASAPGVFGQLVATSYSTQSVDTAAVFAEDYLSLRSNLKVTGSLRVERIDVNHEEFTVSEGISTHNPSGGVPNQAGTFGRAFTAATGRAGLVYDAAANMSVYGNVATAADPSNADFLYGAPADFDLSRGIQVEVGAKHSLPRGLGDWTAAYYWIERRNILTATSPTTSEAIGQQSSRGVELNFSLRPTSRWAFQVSGAVLDARFDDFQESTGSGVVSRNGNRPPNVPNFVFDVHSSYRFGDRVPLELGGWYRRVGDRFNSFDNSSRLLAYDLVDVFATWMLERYRVSVRARNLFDEEYVRWGSQYSVGRTQMELGAPRSAELTLGFSF